MVNYEGSTEKLEFGANDHESVPKKRWNIVVGLCAIFALLALIFVILYATEAKKVKTVENNGSNAGIFKFLSTH